MPLKNLGKWSSLTEKQRAKSPECLQVIRRNSQSRTASTSILTLSSPIRANFLKTYLNIIKILEQSINKEGRLSIFKLWNKNGNFYFSSWKSDKSNKKNENFIFTEKLERSLIPNHTIWGRSNRIVGRCWEKMITLQVSEKYGKAQFPTVFQDNSTTRMCVCIGIRSHGPSLSRKT